MDASATAAVLLVVKASIIGFRVWTRVGAARARPVRFPDLAHRERGACTIALTNRQITKGRTMDDASRYRRWTPRTTPTDVADGGKQGRAGRIRATAATAAARVREQAVKAAMVARPHVVPIVTTVAAVAITSLFSSARDDGRPTGRGPSPSPQCQPTSGGLSSSCRECGRPLTDELSRLAGYGPTCARYLLI